MSPFPDKRSDNVSKTRASGTCACSLMTYLHFCERPFVPREFVTNQELLPRAWGKAGMGMSACHAVTFSLLSYLFASVCLLERALLTLVLELSDQHWQ
jgi:hypothetical protein